MNGRPLLIAALGPLSLALVSLAACKQELPSNQSSTLEKDARVQIPLSLRSEHRELHETLARATREPGELGQSAEALERTMAPHFKREEEIAAPPLGLLPALAQGPATAQMRSVLPMTQALGRELPQMLQEHAAIRQALGRFRSAAVNAKRDDYIRFSDELAAHARQEEEILYPAAIVVGRYVEKTAPER